MPTPGDFVEKALKSVQVVWDFSHFTVRRFFADSCPNWTGALSYTTLLSLVPLSAIGFAMLTAFPVFDDIRNTLQRFIFSNFLPGAVTAVEENFSRFLANTDKLTAIGIVFLGVTAVMLLSTIESTIGIIFRIHRQRPLVQRVLIFWALLTLGPLLIGASLSLSASLQSATQWLGADESAPLFGLSPFLPPLIMFGGLTLLYTIAPNAPVLWRDAAVGAVIAAVLFEILKWLFGLYVAGASVQTVYGALSAIPLFLLWIYLGWASILTGAEIAAGLPEWRAGRRNTEHVPLTPTRRMAISVAVLAAMQTRARTGEGATAEELADDLPATGSEVGDAVADLVHAHFIAEGSDQALFLCRDLAEVTLYDLYRALGMGLSPEEVDTEDPRQVPLVTIFANGERAICETMADDLKSLATTRWADDRGNEAGDAANDLPKASRTSR